MLWTTFFFNQQAVGYITTMYKAFGQSFITNDQFLAIVGSVSSIFNTLGRMFWGGFADKTSFRVSEQQIFNFVDFNLLMIFFLAIDSNAASVLPAGSTVCNILLDKSRR